MAIIAQSWILLLVIWASHGVAQEAPLSWGPRVPVEPRDAAVIQDVIGRQLSAFAQKDGAGAYADVAPNVRRRFPTPEAFSKMAGEGYAPLFHTERSRFVSIRGAGATATQAKTWSQTVAIRTREGQTWLATYGLERQPDGTIKITGCVIVSTAEGSA